MLNAISYIEYEKIKNRDSAKSIFNSLRMTHEGNSQVNKTKALALIQKYDVFKMEDDETVETVFSRFQMLVVGLKVLDKGYSTVDHVKKIMRSLSARYRPKVTYIQDAKGLNTLSLESMIINIQSHEMKLNGDEPVKKDKSLALKS